MSDTVASPRQRFFNAKLPRAVPLHALQSKPEVDFLYARRFTLAQRTALMSNMPKALDSHDEATKATLNLEAQIFLVTSGICDHEGHDVFSPADVEELKNEDAAVIDELAKAVMKANGMGASAAEAAEKK